MGTRSLTRFIEDGKVIAALYGQSDGYVSGHGRDLANILRDGRMVNGYRLDGKEFNGVGCLAAQVVSGLKDGVGQYYLCRVDALDEEYSYDLEVRTVKGQRGWSSVDPEIQVTVRGYDGEELFKGTHNEFVQWAFLEEIDEDDLEEDLEEGQ